MTIPILMYHQIDEPPPRGTPLRGLVVSPSSFGWQMRMLQWLGYKGLSMRDLEPYLKGDKVGKVVGLTFDDGYQNNLLNALPVLCQHGFTATCYGVAHMIGGSNLWDQGKVPTKPLMTQQEWLAWRDAGMDIGSHTLTHADLTSLSAESAHDEMVRSKQELSCLMDYEVRHFCYPYGRYAPSHVAQAREADYVTATTTRRGRVRQGDDLYQLKRIMVTPSTHLLQFWLKLMTTYEDRRT